MRVLIVKTSSMGDVIHTLPALTDAASQLPDVCFDWVVEEAFAEIPKWHRSVHTVIPIAIRRWKRSIFLRSHWQEFAKLISCLRSRQYDYVIDAQGLIKSAVVTRLVNGKRCGLDYDSCRESLASVAYEQAFSINKDQHAIERIRQLFGQSLNYSILSENLNYGLQELQWDANHSDRCLIFVHAASRPEKLWPIKQWVDLALKAQANGFRVELLWGTEAEQQRAHLIANKVKVCKVLPRMNLHSIARLFQRSSAVVAVDTGLSHLAAAIGVPAVTLYFKTSPELVGTRGLRQYSISSSESSQDKMSNNTISVEQVWKTVIKAISDNSSNQNSSEV